MAKAIDELSGQFCFRIYIHHSTFWSPHLVASFGRLIRSWSQANPALQPMEKEEIKTTLGRFPKLFAGKKIFLCSIEPKTRQLLSLAVHKCSGKVVYLKPLPGNKKVYTRWDAKIHVDLAVVPNWGDRDLLPHHINADLVMNVTQFQGVILTL